MRTKHDLDRAFRDAKEEDDQLMSRDAILTLLAANPVSSSSSAKPARVTSTRSSSRMPWLITGSLALAATVALVVVNSWDGATTELSNDAKSLQSAPSTRHDLAASAPNAESRSMAPTSALNEDAKSQSESGKGNGLVNGGGSGPRAAVGDDGTNPPPPKQTSKQSIARTQTIQLDPSLLSRFGLTYARGAIKYTEDQVAVTIRGDGISTVVDTKGNSTSTAPLMVVVYHNQKLYANWWDRSNGTFGKPITRSSEIPMNVASPINGLIAIRVELPAENILATQADVVLWFPGTKAVAEKLPEPFRQQVMSELGLTETETTTHYTIPDAVSTTAIASSVVYPNPLRNGSATIRLHVKKACVGSVVITDMFGKEVATVVRSQSLETGQNDIPLTGLENTPTGVYNVVVSVEGSQELVVQRLMIQR